MKKSNLLLLLLSCMCGYSFAMEDNIDSAQQLYESLSQSDTQSPENNRPKKINSAPKVVNNTHSIASSKNKQVNIEKPQTKEFKEIAAYEPSQAKESVEKEREFSITAGVKKILIFLTRPIVAHPLLTTTVCIAGLIYAYKKEWLKRLHEPANAKTESQKK